MPLQMSTRGRYGVRLMVALALNYGNGSSLLRDIAHREGISEKYLGPDHHPAQGVGASLPRTAARTGGIPSRARLRHITVKDVVEAIEGAIAPVPCADASAGAGKAECADNGDGVERPTARVATIVWRKLHDDIVASLSSFTLQALAREARELVQPAENYVI